jgi:hypothetical protein
MARKTGATGKAGIKRKTQVKQNGGARRKRSLISRLKFWK